MYELRPEVTGVSFRELLYGGGFWTLPGSLHEILLTVGPFLCQLLRPCLSFPFVLYGLLCPLV